MGAVLFFCPAIRTRAPRPVNGASGARRGSILAAGGLPSISGMRYTHCMPTAAPIAPPIQFDAVLARPCGTAQHRIAYGAATGQFGELWLPEGRGPFPLVVLVHGGCWINTLPDLSLVRPLAAALRDRGIAVWNVEYRRIGDAGGGYPGTFLDTAAAADHVRELALRFPLDLARAVAVGHSAGGHLALWLGARPRIASSSPLAARDPVAFRRLFSLGGLGDLKLMHEYSGAVVCGPGTLPKLVDLESRGAAAWDDTSPANLLPLGTPASMIVGAYDMALPPFFDSTYRDLAVARGDEVSVTVLPDAGHFEVIAPWTAGGAEVLRQIETALG